MHRFFVETADFADGKILLVGENAAHAHVLRPKMGEEIVCAISGENVDYFCEVFAISKGEVSAKIIKTAPNSAETPIKITLFQALPKGNKMGDIIESATELGIAQIVPILTSRCIGKGEKIGRWRKIAESAAKVAHRGQVPQIGETLGFSDALDAAIAYDVVFACYEEEQEETLHGFLKTANVQNAKSVAFFIGAEGGFSPCEAALFAEHKIPTVSLGKRILRAQSAAGVVLAQLNFYLEQKL